MDANLKTVGETCEITYYNMNGKVSTRRQNVKILKEPSYAILVRQSDFTKGWNGDYAYVDEHSFRFLKRTVLSPGDVVIANAGSAGKVFQIPALGQPMSLGPSLIRIRSNCHDNGFLKLYFSSPQAQAAIQNIVRNSVLPIFNVSNFRKIKIPCPPMKEQLATVFRIDEKLNDVQQARKSMLEAKLRTQELVGTFWQEKLSSDEARKWRNVELGSLVQTLTGARKPKGSGYAENKTSYPFVSPKDIVNDSVNLAGLSYLDDIDGQALMKYSARPGDIFISTTGSVGRVCTIPDQLECAIISSNFALIEIIDTKAVTSEYLLAYMRSAIAQKYIYDNTGFATVPQIPLKVLKKMPVVLPPRSMMDEVLNMMRTVDNEFDIIEDCLMSQEKAIDELENAILNDAFEGDG